MQNVTELNYGHTTPSRKQIKKLKAEAEELDREARTLRRIKKMQPGVSERLTEAKRLRSEAERLESQARLDRKAKRVPQGIKNASVIIGKS